MPRRTPEQQRTDTERKRFLRQAAKAAGTYHRPKDTVLINGHRCGYVRVPDPWDYAHPESEVRTPA